MGMLVSFLLAASLASAPAPPPAAAPAEPDWVMDAVSVSPAHRGPVMWRIAKRAPDGTDREVWVLPTVEIAVGAKWDTTELDKVLSQSHILYTPPQATLGLGSALGVIFSGRYRLPRGQTLYSLMSPDAAAHARAVLTEAHLDPDKYARLKPGLAALIMVSDVDKAIKLSSPIPTIEAAARKARVKQKPVGSYDAKPVMEHLFAMPDSDALVCVDAAVDEIAFTQQNGAEAGAAWTMGDISRVRRHSRFSGTWACLVRTGVVAQPSERSVRDIVADVKSALDQGGGALFVLGLGSFLSRGGALEALKAEGFRIDAPD